jgi:hypothetical protein
MIIDQNDIFPIFQIKKQKEKKKLFFWWLNFGNEITYNTHRISINYQKEEKILLDSYFSLKLRCFQISRL